LIEHLVTSIGDTGNVVVYNQSFESGVVDSLATTFPEHSEKLQNIRGRLVDLLVPFRNFHYYHPGQMGSASMKKVLPALTGKGYDGMDIGKGDDASAAFYKIALGDISEEEKDKTKKDLERYCALDTEGMVWILDSLKVQIYRK